MIDTHKQPETAVLVALVTQKQTADQTKEYLDELAFLAETSGVTTLKIVYAETRPARYPHLCG